MQRVWRWDGLTFRSFTVARYQKQLKASAGGKSAGLKPRKSSAVTVSWASVRTRS